MSLPSSAAGPERSAAERKAALRAQLTAARRSRPETERVAAGRALRDAVFDLPEMEMAGTVAAYCSMRTEPPTSSLLMSLWKRGAYVILPKLRPDQQLDWASYEGPDSLAPGPRGVLEPTEPARGTGAIARADVVIVPALAVSPAGVRLGRGAGCYDRALAAVGPAILTIALVYDDEIIDTIPAEPHDQLVRAVATPGGGVVRLR